MVGSNYVWKAHFLACLYREDLYLYTFPQLTQINLSGFSCPCKWSLRYLNCLNFLPQISHEWGFLTDVPQVWRLKFDLHENILWQLEHSKDFDCSCDAVCASNPSLLLKPFPQVGQRCLNIPVWAFLCNLSPDSEENTLVQLSHWYFLCVWVK